MWIALALSGCAGAADAPIEAAEAPPDASVKPVRHAAPRYVITANQLVRWDEGRPASVGPRREPALVEGARVLLDGGLVVSAFAPGERFSGFTSVPSRLGGGFLFWSEDTTRRAESFLGVTTPAWHVGGVGGVRPWLDGVLLRGALGLLLATRRGDAPTSLPMPGLVDGRAIDQRRGALIDRFGRVYVTLDGQTFRDLTKEKQLRRYDATDVEELVALAQGRTPEADPTSPEPPRRPLSRELPGEQLMSAVAFGAALPSGDLVAVVEEGLVRVSTRTGHAYGRSVSLPLATPYDECQVASADAERVTLACVHETGGHLLVIRDDPRDVRLEATFGPVTGFQIDPVGRMAAWGPCGSAEPTVRDFSPVAEEKEEGGLDALSDDDEATICVRVAPGRWHAQWIRGAAAKRLYRWVLGPHGTATALVLTEPNAPDSEAPNHAEAPTRTSRGVRVLELPSDGEGLRGGWFAAPDATRVTPGLDRDFWMDASGDIRGWLELPSDPDDSGPDEILTRTPAPRRLRVANEVGGPAAGISIKPSGAIVVHDVPEGMRAMVRGGPYAIAFAKPEGAERTWHETVDGGRSWRLVDGPPVDTELEGLPKLPSSGCSSAGCTWADSVVRLGWGGSTKVPSRTPDAAPPSASVAASVPSLRLS